MEQQWVGKAVSIECDEKLGTFQGIIRYISVTEITINRAFRNGVPLRNQEAEVTLRSKDIQNIKLLPSFNGQSSVTTSVINKPTPVKQPSFPNAAIIATTPNGTKQHHHHQHTPQQLQLRNGIRIPRNGTSTLSSKMSNMNMNGMKRSPPSLSSAVSDQPTSSSSFKTPSPSICSSSVAQFFGNLIPPKVEARIGASFAPCSSTSVSSDMSCATESLSSHASSKPIDILRPPHVGDGSNSTHNSTVYSNSNGNSLSNGTSNGNGPGNGNGNGKRNGYTSSTPGNGNGNGNGRKQQRKQLRRENSIKQQQQTFETSVDDPLLQQDFDFEGNLALFDKQALWNVIEKEQKPDVVRQPVPEQKKKYRHDENILVSEPLQLRQIEAKSDNSKDFVTDEGLIIPTIPKHVRAKVEMNADRGGLSLQRQIDILARGVTDLAISLLGGARRLTPNNCHQWPKIAIICDKSDKFRTSNIGAATGRQLASHGLKVLLYLEEHQSVEQKNVEIGLFKATNNNVIYSVNALQTPDLVILSTNSADLSVDVKKWLSENRASVLAIDPPPSGIKDVLIKYAILPILPLNGISSNNCGKLYLCNLGIPETFYRDAGIKYKSPFGHKFVIPIHSKD